MANDSENLFTQIAEILQVPINIVKQVSGNFHSVFKPRISKEYIAHIVSAMEKEARKITETSLFVIELHPLYIKDKLLVSKSIYRNKERFDIFYPENLDEKEKRFNIAHELAHLYFTLQMGRTHSNFTGDEELCSIFAIIALDDRSQFYDKKAKDYTYKYVDELMSMLRTLHNRKKKRN